MAEERRQEKINFLVRDELAAILNREVIFPNGVMVTITRVVSSPDIYYADVFISVFPKKENDVMKILEKGTPHIQSLLNKELRMRPVPRIYFKIDEEEKARERVEKLLKSIDSE